MKPVTSTAGARTGSSAPPRARQGATHSFRKWIPYGIALALFLAIAAGLRPKPLEVETATIRKGPLTVSVLEEGKTRIRHRYVISATVPGYLHRVALRAGDQIKEGETILAKIQAEPASFLNPRSQAEAEARLQAAEAAEMRAQAELERVRAALSLAEKDAARAEMLKRKNVISPREWDAAENQVAVLGRELRAAEFGARVAQFEVVQARAALQPGPNIDPAKTEPLTILAPVSGYVLNVFEENARVLPPGTPIMEVGDPTDLEAEIELLSSDAVAVQPGAEVSIEQWGGETPLRARVSVIEPGGFTKVSALGVEEQRVKVRVDFSDPLPADHPLGDRFRVEARIITWESGKVLQIPTGALFRRGGDWMTFLVEAGRARVVKVDIAHNNGVAAEVRSGLSEGQTIVLHPPDALTEGSRVRPRR
jgi:HlyD family secretion protein